MQKKKKKAENRTHGMCLPPGSRERKKSQVKIVAAATDSDS